MSRGKVAKVVQVEELAFHQARQRVKDCLADSSKRVLIITADTGVGKSLSIFHIIRELICEGKLPQGKAMLSQPLKSPAIELWRMIEAILEEKVALLCGGIHASAALRNGYNWVVGTAGKLQYFVGADGFLYYVLDEAHEIDMAYEVMPGRLKKLLQSNPLVKVIVMSATLDVNEWQQFFGEEIMAHVHIEGRQYPRTDKAIEVSGRTFSEQLEEFTKAVAEKCKAAFAETKGNVLYFVPSPTYFDRVVEILRRELPSKQFEVVTYWSKTDQDEKDRIIEGGDPGRCTICVCTDGLRTGITVADVVGVATAGWQIRQWYDPELGIGGTREELTEKPSMEQERGRAARTSEGWTLSLEGSDEEERPQEPLPPTKRFPLSRLVLMLKALGEDPRTFPYRHPPAEETLAQAIEALQEIGALTENEELTAIGEAVAELNFEPHLARMILQAAIDEILSSAIPAVVGVSVGGVLTNAKTYPAHESLHRHLRGNFASDYTTALLVWKELCEQFWSNLPQEEERVRSSFKRHREAMRSRLVGYPDQLERVLAQSGEQEKVELQSLTTSYSRIQRLMLNCVYERDTEGNSVWFAKGVYPKELAGMVALVLETAQTLNGMELFENRVRISPRDLLKTPKVTEELSNSIASCVMAGLPLGLYQSGSHHLYESVWGRIESPYLYLFPGSAAMGVDPSWVVGRLETQRGSTGWSPKYWLKDVTKVADPLELARVAPHLYEVVMRRATSYGSGNTVHAEYALTRKGSNADLVTVSERVEEGSPDFLKAVSLALTSAYTNLHPQAGSNSRVLNEARTRYENLTGQWLRQDNAALASVYEEKLANCQTLAAVRQTDISLGVDDMARVLGVPDLSEILAREPEPKAEEQGALESRIRTSGMQVEGLGQMLVTIYPDGEALINLLPEQLLVLSAPPIIPGASVVRIEILGIPLYKSGHAFPGGDFASFQQEVRRVYETHLWSNFAILNRRSLAIGTALPPLPDPKVWNTLTGALAYPAWKDTGWLGGFRLEWFKEKAEAEAAQKRAEAEVAKRVRIEQQRKEQEQARQLKSLLDQEPGARTMYNGLEEQKSKLQKQLESLETATEGAANAVGEAEAAALAWLDVVGKTPLEVVPEGTALAVRFTEQEVSVGYAPHLVTESWYSWAVMCNIAVALPVVNGFCPKSGEEVLVRVVWSSNPQKPWAMSEGAGSGTTRTYFCELVLTPEVIRAQSVLLKEQLATVERQQRELLERLENRLRTKRGQESSRLQPVEDLAYLMETTGAPPSLAHSANLKR